MASAAPPPATGRRLKRGLATFGLCLLWSLVVLYPNPTLLPRAVANAYDPKIDPEAVRHWADELPDDPAYIEEQVESRYVPYAVPWETYGVPWYYPSAREVVEMGAGDCQGRMVVFASILEAKGIPYQLRASFDHIWVEYEGKKATSGENAAIAVMDRGQLQVPDQWDWRESYRIEKEYFWDTAPLDRKVLLFAGLLLILFRGRLVRLVRPRWNRLVSGRATMIDQVAGTVTVWEAERRISAADAGELRNQIGSPYVADVAPHLAAHVTMGLLLPFPFAGFGRAIWTLWMLASALGRWISRRTDRAAWLHAWRVHHPLVALLGAMPVIGSGAYLLATPLRGNVLLWRAVFDTGLSQMPWRLHDRLGTRRLIVPARSLGANPQELGLHD